MVIDIPENNIDLYSNPEENYVKRNKISLLGGVKFAISEIISKLISGKNRITNDNSRGINFRLIDVLNDVSALLENNHNNFIFNEGQYYLYFENLMMEQVAAFAAEIIEMPYHSTATTVDITKFISEGIFSTIHPLYEHSETKGDLLKISENAAKKNTGNEKKRHYREYLQIKKLYDFLLHELMNENDPQKIFINKQENSWSQTTVGNFLSAGARKLYELTNLNELIFVGEKYALFMPKNKNVYPENKAYTNIHQLVYIPRTQKFILLIEQWFEDHSYDDQKKIASYWDETSVDKVQKPTEKLLMDIILKLPSRMKTISSFQVFLETAQALQNAKKKENAESSEPAADISLKLRQQASLGILNAHSESIKQAGTFLAQILLTEYMICLYVPEALQNLQTRLLSAYEMIAHPFMSGKDFIYIVAKNAYMESIRQWLKKVPSQKISSLKQRQQLSSEIKNITKIRNFEKHLNSEQKKIRFQLLNNYRRFGYPQIVERVIKEAWCATSGVGGIPQIKNTYQSFGVTQSVLAGKTINRNELSKIIGENRASQWKNGFCENTNCQNKGIEQLIGECGFCIRCEILSNQGEKLSKDNLSEKNNEVLDFANNSYSHSDEIVDFYKNKFFIRVTDLPTFLISEKPFYVQRQIANTAGSFLH